VTAPMRHVFLSYCHEDADFVRVVEDHLSESGFSVWKDLDLRAGDNWHAEIEGAIRSALAVIVVLSESGQASAYVNFEWAFALGAGVPVVPLLLKTHPDRLHPRLQSLQSLDFTNYMLRPWDALARSLKALMEVERPFTVAVPRDAPPFIQKAARALDSLDASERTAAITLLAEISDASALEVLAEAVRHPAANVREIAAKTLAEAKDLRALPAILDAIRYKRYDYVNITTLIELGDAAVPILVTLLRDPTQGVHLRECIASALGEMLNDQSVEALRELLQDPEESLRVRALKSLTGHPAALPWILEAAHDNETEVRWTALQSLGQYRGAEVVATLIDALHHPTLSVRQVAAEGLVEMADTTATPALLEALRDEDDMLVRSRAERALAKVIDSSLVPTLFRMLEDIAAKKRVANLLVLLKSDAVINRMIELLKNQDGDVRSTVATALGQLGDRCASPALLLALKDDEENVRTSAAFALGALKEPGAVADLIEISRSDDELDDMRRAAAIALEEIGTREARIAYRDWKRQEKAREES
jgi:HEAT repeat protein